jgi:hypothetical protein
MTADPTSLDRLPSGARVRLEAFTAALERVPVDQLGLYADRTWDDEHVAAAERAREVARDTRLTEPIEAAQRALADGVIRVLASSRYNMMVLGGDTAPTTGLNEADRRRILDSLADAVTALVLRDRIDPTDEAELLGLWARLLADT